MCGAQFNSRSHSNQTFLLPKCPHFKLGFKPVPQVIAVQTTRRFPKLVGATVYFLLIGNLILRW
jgi:hypothetical protein